MSVVDTIMQRWHVSDCYLMQILPAAVQCLHVLELSSTGGNGLDALPGMPMALFDFSYLEKGLFLKLQPGLRTALLEGLLSVVNLVREVVNGYGLMHQVVCSGLHHS